MTRAIVISDAVNTLSIFARVVSAFIASVLLASLAGGSSGTKTSKLGAVAVVDTGAAIEAGHAVTGAAGEFAIGSNEAWWAGAMT